MPAHNCACRAIYVHSRDKLEELMSDLYCGSRASDLARVEVNINTKEDVQDPTSNEAANYVRRRERL